MGSGGSAAIPIVNAVTGGGVQRAFDSGGVSLNRGFNDVFGTLTGEKGAEAAGMAAMAQAAEARATREEIMRRSDQLSKEAMDLAAMSPEELRAFDASIKAGHSQLDRDQRLLDAIDPQIMEASKHVLNLMRGQLSGNAPGMDALKAARAQQRQDLLNRLRAQLGPGAETSSMGLKALRDFDIQSSADLAQQSEGFLTGEANRQAQALSGATQGLSLFNAMRPDTLRTGINLTNLAGVPQQRLLNTKIGTSQAGIAALAGASAPVIQSAGAQYAGDVLKEQGKSAFWGNVFNTGLQAAFKGMGGGGRGAAAAAGGGGGGGSAGQSYSNYGNYA